MYLLVFVIKCCYPVYYACDIDDGSTFGDASGLRNDVKTVRSHLFLSCVQL